MRARRLVKGVLQGKQDVLQRRAALLGNGAGDVVIEGNQVWARLAGGELIEVFNQRTPNTHDLPVWIGYDAMEPGVTQVLGVRAAASEGVGTLERGYAPSRWYRWMAENGGQDPLFVEGRQFLPARISGGGGLSVKIYPYLAWTGTQWAAVGGGSVVDVSAHVPTTEGMARLVLFTVNEAGQVGVTAGAEVALGSLGLDDLPGVPEGTGMVLGAVRLYAGQSEIREGRNTTDVVDLRFGNWRATSSGGGGHEITHDGMALPQRAKLEFGGDLFDVEDDEANDRTMVGLSLPESGMGFVGTQLLRSVAGAGGVSSFVCNLPAGYDVVEIFLQGKTDYNGDGEVAVAFNDDSDDGHYRRARWAFGASTSNSYGYSRVLGDFGSAYGDNNEGSIVMRIVNPGAGMHKQAVIQVGWRRPSSADIFGNVNALVWMSTNAITKMEFFPVSATGFAEGTICVVVGYRNRVLGGGGAAVSWELDGSLVVAIGARRYLMVDDRDLVEVRMYVEEPGSSGETVVDVKKNGTSVFSSTAGRPTVAHDSPTGKASATPDDTVLMDGDVLTLDVVEAAVDSENCVVVLKFG